MASLLALIPGSGPLDERAAVVERAGWPWGLRSTVPGPWAAFYVMHLKEELGILRISLEAR